MSNKTIYDYIGSIAMIAAAMSAAISFGWSVYADTLNTTEAFALAVVSGVATAVTLECVGVLAGHVAVSFWHDGNRLWLVAALIMIGYVAAGYYELQGTAVAIVFLISPCVYVLVALQSTAKNQHTAVAEERYEDKQWRRGQAEIRARRKHELELMKVEKSFWVETAVSSDVSRKPAGNRQETKKTAKETMATLWKPGMGPTELAQLAGTSKGYASKYINNGAAVDYQARNGNE